MSFFQCVQQHLGSVRARSSFSQLDTDRIPLYVFAPARTRMHFLSSALRGALRSPLDPLKARVEPG